VVFERVVGRERERIRRDLRRQRLRELGWTILEDNVIFAPGEDPDDASVSWNLATAAREAGLPMDLDELFRWRPNAASRKPTVRDAAPRAAPSVPSRTDTAKAMGHEDGGVTFTPVEEHLTERASFSQVAKDREAVRTESRLVRRLASHLSQGGHEASGVAIAVGHEVIRADLFDHTENVLYEAKAAPDRQKIRMAIGQLLDYKRFITPEPRLRVLLPAKPSEDLCQLLVGVGIGATWPAEDKWNQLDSDSER
jgi:hypothetical protein